MGETIQNSDFDVSKVYGVHPHSKGVRPSRLGSTVTTHPPLSSFLSSSPPGTRS